ncbi:MAG: hypothetical protein WCX22_08650 [Methanoregula sp.]
MVPAIFSWIAGRIFGKRVVTIAIVFSIATFVLTFPATASLADPNDSSVPFIYPGSDPTILSDDVTFPSIAYNATPGILGREYTFSFQQENITIRTPVSAGIYYGAKNGNKFATAPPDSDPEDLAPGYYRAFIDDPAQDPLYADLMGSFHAIRQEYRYTDDEYLELLAVFVQSIPYDNASAAIPDTVARFPAETLVDGTGDCDDKSVLLAGLLSREGYNVSLLLFIPEHHMAVGVDSDHLLYGDTGYMYVETTGLSFMGDVPKQLNQSEKYLDAGQSPGIIPLTSTPVVIRVGTGSKKFTRSGETRFILAQKSRIDARIASVKAELDNSSREDPARFRALLERYSLYVGIHNFIAKHRNDRAGTYQYLSSLQMPACTESFSGGSGQVNTSAFCKPVTTSGNTSPYDCACPPPPAEDPYGSWYIPCPRGIWISQQCLWQSVRQVIVPPSC